MFDMEMFLSKRAILSLNELENQESVSMQELGFKHGVMEASYEDLARLRQVKPRRTTVQLDKLYSPQLYVNVEDILRLMKKPQPYKSKSHNSPFRPEAKWPQVIEYNGKLYIADGNHRLAASKLLGHQSVEVLLYRIPDQAS